MASKNLRKVLKRDITLKTTWEDFPINAEKALKYVKTKASNKVRNDLYKQFYTEFRAEGYGKKEAKEMVKAKLKAHFAAEQGLKEQEGVLPKSET